MTFSSAVQGYSQNYYYYKEKEEKMLGALDVIADRIKCAIEVKDRSLLQSSYEDFYALWIDILKTLYGFFFEMFAAIEEEAEKGINIDAKKILDDSLMKDLKKTFDHYMPKIDICSVKVFLFENQHGFSRIALDDEEKERRKFKLDGVKAVGKFNIDDLDGLKQSFEKLYEPWYEVVKMVDDHLEQSMGRYFADNKKGFYERMYCFALTDELFSIFEIFNVKEHIMSSENSKDQVKEEKEEENEEGGFMVDV